MLEEVLERDGNGHQTVTLIYTTHPGAAGALTCVRVCVVM